VPETNQGGESQWVLGGLEPKLPVAELVQIDDSRRLLIPKTVRRRLPTEFTPKSDPIRMLCECRQAGGLRLSLYSERGSRREGELRDEAANDDERLGLRSRFQAVTIEKDSRILLPNLVVAHLYSGAIGSQLVGCFFPTFFDVMLLEDWQKRHLADHD
jgi:hypothetical protein